MAPSFTQKQEAAGRSCFHGEIKKPRVEFIRERIKLWPLTRNYKAVEFSRGEKKMCVSPPAEVKLCLVPQRLHIIPMCSQGKPNHS